MKIALIFRSPERKEHSIENVFSSVYDYINTQYTVENRYAPEWSIKSPIKLLKNLKFAKSIEADVYHTTGDIHYVSCVTPKDKSILTIHDLVQLETSKGIKYFLMWMFWFNIPIKRCKYLTCISKKVYGELEEKFPACKGKLYLIPDPVDKMYSYHEKEFNKDKPRILVIGSSWNKNVIRIIESVKDINCTLDVVGRLSEEQKERLAEYHIDYTNCFNIDNSEILQKYISCDIVCFPSLYEGFGMPIIEGQTVGRVIVTSDLAPMNDVADGSACLVNPESIDSIRRGLEKVISDDSYRNELVKKGIEKARKYDSENIAKMFCDLYSNFVYSERRQRND